MLKNLKNGKVNNMTKIVKVNKELKSFLEENKRCLPWLYYNFMCEISAYEDEFKEIAAIATENGCTISDFISLYLQGEFKLIDGKYYSFYRLVLTGDFGFTTPFEVEDECEIIWYNKPTYTMVQSHAAKIPESEESLINELEADGWIKQEVFNL